VTGPATTQAVVRVGKATLGILDSSNAVFEISSKVVEPIVVVAPNGGEQWRSGTKQMVKWTAPSSVTSVDIDYSPDGGTTWLPVKADAPSAGANPQFEWTIPIIPARLDNSLVRVRDHANPGLSDISNAPFSLLEPIAGFEAPVAGLGGLQLLGNFPNPFAALTELRWRQARASDVEIRIYNQSGSMAGSYKVGRRDGGEQTFTISGAELASGTYMYEIHAGASVARGVMVLVR
jgi:hypothetical protein